MEQAPIFYGFVILLRPSHPPLGSVVLFLNYDTGIVDASLCHIHHDSKQALRIALSKQDGMMFMLRNCDS